MIARAAATRAETLDDALRLAVAAVPDKDFLRFTDSGTTTFAAFDALVDEFAGGFSSRGIGRGDVVAVMLPNSLEYVTTWFALARLGAVTAAINVELRGRGLSHVFRVARNRLLVLDEAYVAQLSGVADEIDLDSVLVRGGTHNANHALPWKVEPLDALQLPGHVGERARVEPGDLLMLLFTSGTSGVSKACAISHHYAIRQGELFATHFGLEPSDVLYCPFPLFHGDATMYTVLPAVLLGATAALGSRFSVSRFWDEVRTVGATTFDFMGATLALLMKQPPSSRDREHTVRLAYGIPLPEFATQFTERFGVPLATAYGLTETGVLVYQPSDEPLPHGAAGKTVEPYELRIVDDEECDLIAGEIGEILVRSREPHVLADGYYGMPEATAATFGGWVRTGDLGRLDTEGFLYFEGRKKDALRRRGENISAFEIEQVVDQHPAVLESAVCGVESELTEQDVMVWIVPRPGEAIDPRNVVDFCSTRMASYMVPRYIEVVEALPKTPTEKIAKNELAKIGVTDATWDREADRG